MLIDIRKQGDALAIHPDDVVEAGDRAGGGDKWRQFGWGRDNNHLFICIDCPEKAAKGPPDLA